MPKLLFLTLLLAIAGFAVKGDSIKTKPPVKHIRHVLYIDSSEIQARHFNADSLKQYNSNKDFQYNDDDAPAPSYWSRFWHWVWKILERLFSVNTGHWSYFTLIQYLILLLAVAFLVYVVFKIIGIDVLSLFRRRSKGIEIPYTESLENIHEISFDDEIEKAVANRNYRLAVRLLYLRSLKQLSDAQLINWQIDKTNSAYLKELTDAEKRQSFGMLTRQFEYVWYGDFPVDGQAFQNIRLLFHDFKQLLS